MKSLYFYYLKFINKKNDVKSNLALFQLGNGNTRQKRILAPNFFVWYNVLTLIKGLMSTSVTPYTSQVFPLDHT